MNYGTELIGGAALLETAVAGYALRLHRLFGATRVGWSIFAAFGMMALVHLLLPLDLTASGQPGGNLLIPGIVTLLLLIGMVHVEMVLRQRAQAQEDEVRVRNECDFRNQERIAVLTLRNRELQAALDRRRILSGLLPICCSCKRIRDGAGGWNKLEIFIAEYSEAKFTHGLCPECMAKCGEELAKDRAEASPET